MSWKDKDGWTHFAPGEEPEVLTTTCADCRAGNCEKCKGFLKLAEYPGRVVLCIHECHDRRNIDRFG